MGSQTSSPASSDFPAQYARTQRFSLGVPRAYTVGASRVLFLRSRTGDDRTGCLWSLDLDTGTERLLVDPAGLSLSGEEELSPAERALRERRRESGAGIVAYATDQDTTVAAFALSGRLFVADTATGRARELPTATPVIDPRPDPTGRRVAYVSGGALRVVDVDDGNDRALADPDGPGAENVTYGLAEFIAAEEMGRTRGYWWSPDGEHLLVTRVDNAPVQRWYLTDPSDPAAEPTELRYPSAGTPNADVTAFVLGLGEAAAGAAVPARVEVDWDRDAFPYLAAAHWSGGGAPLLAVQSRDQRTVHVVAVDPGTGETRRLAEDTDPHWVHLVPGTPAWTHDGRLLRVVARGGAYRLLVGDDDLTGDAVHVREVLDVGEGDEGVLVSGWQAGDGTQVHVFRTRPGGAERVTEAAGVHTAVRSGDVDVLVSSGLDWSGPRVVVSRAGAAVGSIASRARTPVLTPNVELLTAGSHGQRCALLLPTGYEPGSGPLPVLMDPYGGPMAQRVLAHRNGYLVGQWFADQGFAVVVVDGRGAAGCGPDADRAIALDFGVTLADQVDALQALAATRSELDLSRVAIRGWSYGGYLAARAVIDRPDVFHAAVGGAPPTDWRLYTTHYTERYLGDPADHPDVYAADSLLERAANLSRPLLLVHGLADDNVVSAHTLRLSSTLLASGRVHQVLPLSGTSHMTSGQAIAENLLHTELEFLRTALGLRPST